MSQPLTVVATTPAAGATGVSGTATVAVTFSEALDGGALQSSWLTATVSGAASTGPSLDPQDPSRLQLPPFSSI